MLPRRRPHLASLHLVVQFRRLGVFTVTVCEAASPVEASIHFLDKPKVGQVHGSCYYHQDHKDLLIALCKLLRSLSNVSHLELSGFGDMVRTSFQLANTHLFSQLDYKLTIFLSLTIYIGSSRATYSRSSITGYSISSGVLSNYGADK